MLVLKRREGQWVDIVHKSGDVLRIRLYDINDNRHMRQANLAFDDAERNFEIQRPERNRIPGDDLRKTVGKKDAGLVKTLYQSFVGSAPK